MRYARLTRVGLLAVGAVILVPSPVFAGMPSVALTDVASMRLQTISFFLMLFLLASLIVRWIWNSLQSEFARLPRLSYPKALGLVGLWGLLFLLVLTMISGARELMTPGAWKKEGVTYTLDVAPTEEIRRERLFALFAALAAYALQHDGRYPSKVDTAIPADLWKTPHISGMRYVYLSNRSTKDLGRILACEPELFGDDRLVLFTTGEVKRMTSAELTPLLAAETNP